jgi:hypothetical protein
MGNMGGKKVHIAVLKDDFSSREAHGLHASAREVDKKCRRAAKIFMISSYQP